MIRASVGTSTFPSRSNRARSRLGITIASISILIALTSQLFGQALPPTAPLQQGALYLQTGVIYTETLTDLSRTASTPFEDDVVKVLVLDQSMHLELRRDLESLSVELLDYLPSNSFTVRLKGVSRTALLEIPEILRIVEYRPEWKIQPGLVERLGTHREPDRQELDRQGKLALIVSLHPQTDRTAAVAAIVEQGGEVLRVDTVGTHDELSVVALPEQLNLIAALEDVLFIEDAPDITFRNNTNRWIVQTNVNNQTPVYDNGIHGESQVIGVLDGRVDQNHCALSGGKIIQYNSSAGSDTHGTHVADTAAGNNGLNDNTRGVAYEAGLAVNTVPAFNETAINQRLNLHHGQGARIHTNSWGNDGTTSYDSLARGFDVFLRNNEESFVCLAVTNGAVLRNPENAKNLLAVGASQDTPNQASHCSGGVGPTTDGRRKPEVYAPGCGTQSASAGSGCGTTGLTGTSMATPAVAGASALIRQYFTAGYYPSGSANVADALTPSGALIKAMVINSAVDMTGVGGYPSNLEGWGRIRINDSLFFPGNTRQVALLDDVRNVDGFSTGGEAVFNVTINGSGEVLRVTAVWTDVAATAGTAFASINDLDLEVTSPSGTLFRGNVFSGGFSSSGGTKDDRNNVEQVHVNNPEVGSWTVRIRGAAVNSGTQGYSIVATGNLQLAPPDCNGNGIPDADDIAAGATDCDGNGIPDSCEPDCNSNGVTDACDISGGVSTDCNLNGVPDSCDLASGASTDCDGNGALDECQLAAGAPDCNSNGQLDSCDISLGTSFDCDLSGVPDECESAVTLSVPSTPGLSIDHLSPTVATINVGSTVVITDLDVAVQITHTWIGDLGINLASPSGTVLNLKSDSSLDVDNINVTFDDAGVPYSEPDLPNGLTMQPQVSALSGVNGENGLGTWTMTITDSFAGDNGTLNLWRLDLDGFGSPPDCDSDGTPDACELDCNMNMVPDDCDLSSGTSLDTNMNGIPDECESGDCNSNGVPDDEDIAMGTEQDCDLNAVPDSCQSDNDLDGTIDPCDPDDDNDTWSDTDETACGTDPLSAASLPTDSDSDGTCDVVDPDDDNDLVPDGQDSAPLDNTVCRDADNDGCDDCSSGVDNPASDGLDSDGDGLCDTGDPDDDNDGWIDTDEASCGTDPLNSMSVPTDTDTDGICDVVDPDDDNDNWTDTAESACGTDPLNSASVPADNDSDGQCDLVDPDDDNDGVADGQDSAPFDGNVCRDLDSDGCDDCSSGIDNPANDGVDTDGDGQCNAGDPDDDGDGWSDTEENDCGSNPLNSASVPVDTDMDGSCNGLDPDDDNDGVPDLQDSAPLNNFICRDVDGDGCDDCSSGVDNPAADGPDADSDGICDIGDLDADNDGWSDTDEVACGTDPTDNTSVPTDTDSDGICNPVDPDDDNDGSSDAVEMACGTDPLDQFSTPIDTDGDGLCNGLDPDDDNDGVIDVNDNAPLDNTSCRDLDGDGCDDCSSGSDDPLNDGADSDGDGVCDLGDACPGSDDSIDCNLNGIPDGCDISSGSSSDNNGNGIPDDCEAALFVRGDSNADGGPIDISDPVHTLAVLFMGAARSCDLALDANDDEMIDLADVIYTLTYVFGNGTPPPAPWPTCGVDPTSGPLDCTSFASCP